MECSVPTGISAAERARWLAQLADALADAHDLLVSLNLAGECRSEANDLFVRIQAARIEVQSLRLSRSLRPRDQFTPERMEWQPWTDRQTPSGKSPPPANGSR